MLIGLDGLAVAVLQSFVMYVAISGRPANALGLTTSLRKMTIISYLSGMPTSQRL